MICLVVKNRLEPLPCLFVPHVVCFRCKSGDSIVVGRCIGCRHYEAFMSDMLEDDMEEDMAFLAESERLNRFAKCLFEPCLCDGELGKFACFGCCSVGNVLRVCKCPRFHVDKLESGSVMRQSYLDLVKEFSV